MGNLQQSLKVNTLAQYQPITAKISSISGSPTIVKSRKTQIELEEYLIKNNDLEIMDDAKIFKLRSSSYSKNIAVVFTHDLLSQNEKTFKVRTQKMKGRLNLIYDLTYLESMCILEAALNGFSQLIFHTKKPFLITDKMIAVNEICQVRVWVNENFALNKIMESPIHMMNQAQMIERLIYVIGEHVSREDRQRFYAQKFNLVKFSKLIFAKNHVASLLNGTNRKNMLKELINKEIRKQEESRRLEMMMKQRKENLNESQLSSSFILNRKMDQMQTVNTSNKKMQMYSQKKSIFKKNQRQIQKSQIVEDVDVSSFHSPQKQNRKLNEAQIKNWQLSKSGIKLDTTLKSLQKKIQKIGTEMNDLSRSRLSPKITITTVNKNYNSKNPRFTENERSLTPKAKVYQNQSIQLRKSGLNEHVKSQFSHFQRPSEPFIEPPMMKQKMSEELPRGENREVRISWNKSEVGHQNRGFEKVSGAYFLKRW